MQITLKTLSNKKIDVTVEGTVTVKAFKDDMEKAHGFKASTTRYICAGKVLEDDAKTLMEYKVVDKSTVVVLESKKKPAETAPAPAPTPAPATATATATAPVVNTPAPTPAVNQPAAPAVNAPAPTPAVNQPAVPAVNTPAPAVNVPAMPGLPPMPAMPGMGGMGGAGGMAGMAAVLAANPQMLGQLLMQDPQLKALSEQNPAMFQSMLSNPQFINMILGGIAGGMGGAGGDGGDDDDDAPQPAPVPMPPAPASMLPKLSEAEEKDVKELMELTSAGKSTCTEAYLICDKNKENAIGYIFDQRGK